MKPRLFWDSSGLLGAIMSSSENSPGRVLFALGEAGLIDMRVSREVLNDCDRVLRSRKPVLVRQLAVILHQARIVMAPEPNREIIARCTAMTEYTSDARVLAAAIACDADLFLSQDSVHFLQNPLIGSPDTKPRVVTLQQALEWLRDYLKASSEG